MAKAAGEQAVRMRPRFSIRAGLLAVEPARILELGRSTTMSSLMAARVQPIISEDG